MMGLQWHNQITFGWPVAFHQTLDFVVIQWHFHNFCAKQLSLLGRWLWTRLVLLWKGFLWWCVACLSTYLASFGYEILEFHMVGEGRIFAHFIWLMGWGVGLNFNHSCPSCSCSKLAGMAMALPSSQLMVCTCWMSTFIALIGPMAADKSSSMNCHFGTHTQTFIHMIVVLPFGHANAWI